MRNEVKLVAELLSRYPLKTETNASGTNLEGELDISEIAFEKVITPGKT